MPFSDLVLRPHAEPDPRPHLWYESLREDLPGYDRLYAHWIQRVQAGEASATGLARDILGASEYHPWYASVVHQPAQHHVMAILAGCPRPEPWLTLWPELMVEHQNAPDQQQQAWSSIRDTLMAQVLGSGHPSVMLEFLAWNHRLPTPHVWSADQKTAWIGALTAHGLGPAPIITSPLAQDPERGAGVKLLALIDAGHLAWSDVTQACAAPRQGITVGNVLWQTPGMAPAIERAHRNGHLPLHEDDIYHLWCSNDASLWDLAERLDLHTLCRGVERLQAHRWWTDHDEDTGPAACTRSREAWHAVEQRLLRALLPVAPEPARPAPRRL